LLIFGTASSTSGLVIYSLFLTRCYTFVSGQVDSQLQITGSILQPNISGNIKISQGEAYLPHDKGGTPTNRFPSKHSGLPTAGVSRVFASRYVSRFLNSESASSRTKVSQSSGSGITLHVYLFSL